VVKAGSGRPEAELERAYRACARIARRHYENFPVASLLLPAHMRPAIAAIYAFARRADDFADEPGPDADERIRLLNDWGRRLHACGRGSTEDDLIFIALHDAIQRHKLPMTLLDDLLSAFRQDVTTNRYGTWAEVLDYCNRSASPVGRLVLRVAGYDDPALDERSDAICTALQLTNFWQDFGVDWRRGRLYLPVEDRERTGADERDLDAGRWTGAWKAVMDVAIGRTRELFAQGRPLCDAVGGRLRWELRLTWLGGSRTLDKVQRVNVLETRPHLTRGDVAILLARAAAWR
jgi:squalene synthase HpnC